MKQKLLLKTMLLLFALIAGSSSVWAALTPTYTLTATQNSGNTGYSSNYDVTIGGIVWNAPGNQNFDGYWRIGGKKVKAADPTLNVNRVITGKNAITGQIKKVTVFHNGKSHDAISVPTVTLTIASDAGFSNVVDEIEVHPSISTSTAGSFDFTPTSPITHWKDCYYKFTINITNTITNNHGLDLTSIAFYIESAEVAITGITLPSTADVPVGKTRTLTATVTPDNYTGTVDWESDDESIATVSSEGVVTGVAAGSTTIRAKSHANSSINAECAVTVNEDIATLPFNWDGGTSSEILALYGVTGNSLGDYAVANAPYRIQFNSTSDYIQVKTNALPGKVYVGVKMIGGSTTSKIKIQESEDGSTFTDVEEFTIEGNQDDTHDFVTTKNFDAASRYVRIIKSVHATGGNIGVGPIKITGCVTASITAAGWATYCSPYALDFSSTRANLDGAYIVTGNTGTTLDLSPAITTTVPANTGLLLKGSGEVTIPVAASGAFDATGNKLHGVTAETVKDENTIYVLMNEAAGVGFYKNSNAFTVGANTAYLAVGELAGFEGGSSAPTFMAIGDDNNGTTGVETLNVERGTLNDNSYYNLNGQRVAQPTKGLYIVNGRKVVIK